MPAEDYRLPFFLLVDAREQFYVLLVTGFDSLDIPPADFYQRF